MEPFSALLVFDNAEENHVAAVVAYDLGKIVAHQLCLIKAQVTVELFALGGKAGEVITCGLGHGVLAEAGLCDCTACVKHKILYDSTGSCCSEKRLCRCG